jgi:hypothetical protein
VRYPALLLLFAISSFFASYDQAHASDSGILSKDDAAKLFTYSQKQWNENVKKSVRAGIAKEKESSEGTLTLYVFGDRTTSGVMPIYAEDDPQAPFALQVSNRYSPEHPLVTSLKKDPDIADNMCKKGVAQMEPEFASSCKHEKVAGAVIFNFLITKTGSPNTNWVKQIWKK